MLFLCDTKAGTSAEIARESEASIQLCEDELGTEIHQHAEMLKLTSFKRSKHLSVNEVTAGKYSLIYLLRN